MLAFDAGFTASLDGVEFRGDEYRDEPGIYIERVEGTLDGGSVRYESVPSGAGNGDGELDVPNLRVDPRIILMQGFAVARTMRELATIGENLRGLAQFGLRLFEWTEFGQTYATQVRRGTGNVFEPIGRTGWAEVTLRLRAPSQRIYGAQHPKAGPATTITVPNRGNFPALPVFDVTGNMPDGYRLVGDGAEYIVTQGLAPGQTHRINMRDLSLTRNGAGQGGGTHRGRALIVPERGELTVTLIPASGAGQVSCIPVDNYI